MGCCANENDNIPIQKENSRWHRLHCTLHA
jgi:hypothetical protein